MSLTERIRSSSTLSTEDDWDTLHMETTGRMSPFLAAYRTMSALPQSQVLLISSSATEEPLCSGRQTRQRPRSTSVSIPDTFCRHRLEPKSPAGRCRIVRRGTTFLVARSCSVRLSPHHIHSLARRNIHHRNTGREHHNSHHHNSIALRRCSQSLKETSPQTGTMQVSSWSPPTCGT